jgi:hypothetical protein
LIKAERVEHRNIPAVTRIVEEQERVTAETYRDEHIAARYETVSERVLATPEREIWTVDPGIRTGAALVTPIDHEPVPYRADGTLTWPGKTPVSMQVSEDTAQYLEAGSGQAVYCLKRVPAEYKTVTKSVEVEPARTHRVHVPATYKKVKRVVVDQEARVEKIVIPAVYETRKVKQIVKPASTETYTIPAVYEERAMSRVAESAKPVWREVLCERNATPQTISLIQKALIARGYDAGATDGVLGPKTVRAVQQFSADNGLAQGQVSLEAVKALGVN